MKKFSMCGPLGDPLSPLTPVSYKVHWTRSPHQLPGSFPQSIRTLPHPPEGVEARAFAGLPERHRMASVDVSPPQSARREALGLCKGAARRVEGGCKAAKAGRRMIKCVCVCMHNSLI